jgi:hypothetical protein
MELILLFNCITKTTTQAMQMSLAPYVIFTLSLPSFLNLKLNISNASA